MARAREPLGKQAGFRVGSRTSPSRVWEWLIRRTGETRGEREEGSRKLAETMEDSARCKFRSSKDLAVASLIVPTDQNSKGNACIDAYADTLHRQTNPFCHSPIFSLFVLECRAIMNINDRVGRTRLTQIAGFRITFLSVLASSLWFSFSILVNSNYARFN